MSTNVIQDGEIVATSEELAPRPADRSLIPSDDEIGRLYRLAKGLALSGLFKDAKTAEVGFAKILLGHDLGLTATQALTSIHIVEGKPELSANLQAALLRQYRSPEGERYDFRIEALDPAGCALRFLRVNRHGEAVDLGVSEFSIKDAQDAGLAGRPTWKAYARNMLFSRALSNGVAWFAPEVTFGVRVYTAGEISGRDPSPAARDDLPWAPGEGEPPADVVGA